jgi:hypothetical protein
MPPTFHGAIISNHDLKIVDHMDIAHGLLRNVTMDEIIGASTYVKQNIITMMTTSRNNKI